MNEQKTDLISGFNEDVRDDLKLSLSLEAESDDIIVINLTGQIDTYSSTYFLNKIEEVTQSGYVKIIFNMVETKFVSAMGLSSLNTILKNVTGLGGNIILTGLRQNVIEVFQISQFLNLFTIKENVHSAILSFENMEKENI